MTLDLRHWDILRKRDGADDMVLDGAAIARIPWPRTEAPVKTLASVVACGLMAIPRLSDTLHLQVGDNRLAMANDADPWHATTERLLGKEELASIRRELRAMVLAQAMATVPPWAAIVERLKRQAMAMPLWYLWLLAILAPPTMIGSAIWMITGASVVKHVLGSAGLALFAAIAMQAIYGLIRRLHC